MDRVVLQAALAHGTLLPAAQRRLLPGSILGLDGNCILYANGIPKFAGELIDIGDLLCVRLGRSFQLSKNHRVHSKLHCPPARSC